MKPEIVASASMSLAPILVRDVGRERRSRPRRPRPLRPPLWRPWQVRCEIDLSTRGPLTGRSVQALLLHHRSWPPRPAGAPLTPLSWAAAREVQQRAECCHPRHRPAGVVVTVGRAWLEVSPAPLPAFRTYSNAPFTPRGDSCSRLIRLRKTAMGVGGPLDELDLCHPDCAALPLQRVHDVRLVRATQIPAAPLWLLVSICWAIAFLEYCFAVQANHIGHRVYSAAQLKTIQEVITLIVFAVFPCCTSASPRNGITWFHSGCSYWRPSSRLRNSNSANGKAPRPRA